VLQSSPSQQPLELPDLTFHPAVLQEVIGIL